MKPWRAYVPEGARLWVCSVCNADSHYEVGVYCARRGDLKARCGHAEAPELPECLDLAWPLYTLTRSA